MLPPQLRRLSRRALREPRAIMLGPGAGLRFNFDPDREIRFWLGLYEAEIARSLRRFARPGTVSMVIGADMGYHVAAVARATQALVIAFEPRETSRRRALEHVALNAGTLGPVELRSERIAAQPGEGVETVDAVCAQSSVTPGFLLIDVDGGEHDVLLGARRLLSEHQPDLIIETHTPELESSCAELLIDHQYRPRILTQRRFLRDFRVVAHNQWIVAAGASSRPGSSPRQR